MQHTSTAGPITIRATRKNSSGDSRSGGGEEITVIVAGQGPGVPEESLTKIFDAFYRLDTSRARATGGTGLGLAIVKTRIESCCGTVTAHNRLPAGLQVHVILHIYKLRFGPSLLPELVTQFRKHHPKSRAGQIATRPSHSFPPEAGI